jgi:hypothetical protein
MILIIENEIDKKWWCLNRLRLLKETRVIWDYKG